MIREGVLKPPVVIVTPPDDYLSVLGRRLDPDGKNAVKAPALWFGFGFASHFPLVESSDRETVPMGAHHLFGQILAWGASDPAGNPCAAVLSCSFSSLHGLAVASFSEMSLKGRDQNGVPLRYSVLVNDFDVGLAWRRDWQWAGRESATVSWGGGYLVGYLPLRQRNIVQYGTARPEAADLLRSGVHFNYGGLMARVSLSVILISVFEGTAFLGLVAGVPSEARAWAGLEFALRSPADSAAPSIPLVEPSAPPKAGGAP